MIVKYNDTQSIVVEQRADKRWTAETQRGQYPTVGYSFRNVVDRVIDAVEAECRFRLPADLQELARAAALASMAPDLRHNLGVPESRNGNRREAHAEYDAALALEVESRLPEARRRARKQVRQRGVK